MLRRSKWKLAALIALAVVVVVSAPLAWFAAKDRKIDALVADLGSKDYAISTRAEDALPHLTSAHDMKRLIWHLGDENARYISDRFALVFGMMGERAVKPLLSMYERSTSRLWYATPLLPEFVRAQLDNYIDASNRRRQNFREVVPRSFRYLGKPAVERLAAIIESGDSRHAILAINALTHMVDADTLRPLIHALNSSDPDVRVNAWEGLSMASQVPTLGPITDLTSLEIDLLAGGLAGRSNRRAAAAILGSSDNPAAAERLAALLVSPDAETRVTGAVGLSIRSDKRALPILLEEVKERDKEHLGFAIGILGRYDAPEAVSILVKALDNPNPGTRYSAAWGLAQIIGRKDAADYAARESAEKAIRDALSGGDDVLKEEALRALDSIKDERALEPLKDQLRRGDTNARVRALLDLGYYDEIDAGAVIVNALEDKEARVRSTAAFVLGRSKDPRAQKALVRALSDGDAGVRNQAAESLRLRKCLDAARKNGARILEEH